MWRVLPVADVLANLNLKLPLKHISEPRSNYEQKWNCFLSVYQYIIFLFGHSAIHSTEHAACTLEDI